MKTKEELKKIFSAYYPYELEVSFDGKVSKLLGLETDYVIVDEAEFCDYYKLEQVKPLFWSMDMLTKEIEHKGERFIPLHKILEEYCFDLSKMDEEYILSFKESLIEIDMSYKTFIMLAEWHFNVFSLSDSEYIQKENLKV